MNTQVDIEHWRPKCRRDIVGNYDFVEYATDFIYGVRQTGHRGGYNLLYLGDSRSGKTSGVSWLLQCLGCYFLDLEKLAACGTCENCRYRHHIVGNRDWEDLHLYVQDAESKNYFDYHLSVVNGAALTSSGADDLIAYVSREVRAVKIVYIDEALRLDLRIMDQLLPPMDNTDAIWIATSVPRKTSARSPRGEPEDNVRVREMFANRFTYKIATQLPKADDLAIWLAERCREFGIRCEEPESTLRLVAERSRCVPGRALQVLNRAHKSRKQVLTRQLVESHAFDFGT